MREKSSGREGRAGSCRQGPAEPQGWTWAAGPDAAGRGGGEGLRKAVVFGDLTAVHEHS